jgi:hypothetical protein
VEWRQSSSNSTQLQPAARRTGNNNHVDCYGKQFEHNHEHPCGICCGQNGIGTVFLQALHFYVSRGSSVSTVSGYGLDHRKITSSATMACSGTALLCIAFTLSVSFHHGSPCSYLIWGIKSRSVRGRSSETQAHPIHTNMNNHELAHIRTHPLVWAVSNRT